MQTEQPLKEMERTSIIEFLYQKEAPLPDLINVLSQLLLTDPSLETRTVVLSLKLQSEKGSENEFLSLDRPSS